MSAIAPTHADDQIAAMLESTGRRTRFRAGTTIQEQGDSGDGFWLIRSGQVSTCRFGHDGTLTVYAVFGPGDLFGELACFAGVPRQVGAVAETDAELLWVPASRIDHLLETDPRFARWLLHSLANQLRSALDRIELDRALSAEARIAQRLAELARHTGNEIVVTQQELADLTGVSRVTCGQALAKLSAAGVIERRYGRIIVLDAETLAAAAS